MSRPMLSALLLAGCVCLSGSSTVCAAGKVVREYDLTRSLTERGHGGPNLLAKDAAIGQNGARFSAGTGFEVEDLGVSDGYRIEMAFRADQVDSYRKLIDFKSRASDEGLYIHSGALAFYDATSGGEVQAGKEYRVTIERDPKSTLVRVSLDGFPVFQFEDPMGAAVFDNRHALFFLDDTVTSGEETGGTLRSLRVWNEAGEPLPRRAAPGKTFPTPLRVLHDYRFHGGLEDAAGGGAQLLPEGGAGSDAGGLHFEAGRGFHLPNSGVSDDYAVELTFSLDEMSGYRKLIDFKNRDQDSGLYVYNGHLTFYGVSVPSTARRLRGGVSDEPDVRVEMLPPRNESPYHALRLRSGRYTGTASAVGAELQPGHTYHVRIERTASGLCRVLLDGQRVLLFNDEQGLAVFENGQAYFFMDDTYTTNEQSSGTVNRIQIWGPGK